MLELATTFRQIKVLPDRTRTTIKPSQRIYKHGVPFLAKCSKVIKPARSSHDNDLTGWPQKICESDLVQLEAGLEANFGKVVKIESFSVVSAAENADNFQRQDEAVARRHLAVRGLAGLGLQPRGLEDGVQCGQPRRQEAVRRPLVQLQQAGEASGQYYGSLNSAHQAQALSTYRRGKCFLLNLIDI